MCSQSNDLSISICLYFSLNMSFLKTKCDHYKRKGNSLLWNCRESYRTGRPRTAVHGRLPSQSHTGVQFVHVVKRALIHPTFKTGLNNLFIAEAFSSPAEFLAHDWDNVKPTDRRQYRAKVEHFEWMLCV